MYDCVQMYVFMMRICWGYLSHTHGVLEEDVINRHTIETVWMPLAENVSDAGARHDFKRAAMHQRAFVPTDMYKITYACFIIQRNRHIQTKPVLSN